MSADYLRQLGRALNLEYISGVCPYRVLTAKAGGAVIGLREGRILSIGLLRDEHENDLVISVKFASSQDSKTLQTALQNIPGLLGGSGGRKLTVGTNALIIQWRYAILKPAASDVINLVENIFPVISALTKPLEACTKCGAEGGEVVLWNEIPDLHCAKCQRLVVAEAERDLQSYAKRPITLLRACLTASLAGLLLAIVAGAILFYYASDNEGLPPRLVILIAVVISAVVGYVFERNIGRIELRKHALIAGCIAWGSIFIAELIDSTLLTMQQFEMKASLYVIFWAAKILVIGRLTPGLDLVVTLMQLAACLIPGYFLKKAKPQLEIDYRRLSDAARSQATAAR